MSRRVLCASVSALALLAYAAPANAVCVGRCGGGGASAVTTVATSAIASAQQAALATQQTMNSLTRATLAIQAIQAAQTAARNLALGAPSSAPNGLVTGGLVPDSGLAAPGVANSVRTWTGANTPTQTTNNGQTVVTIQQTQPQAILNWQSFNVGVNTTVDFNQQGNTNWAALNKISATGVPSQILGSIRSDGQVYLINQSGIIFGGSSQVNVGSLIASTLAITDQQFLKGIVNQNAYDSINQKIFDPVFANTSTTPAGNITVEPGAIIQTAPPNSVTTGGGFVYLFGSNVSNGGTIVTPDGQAVLAAGSVVYLTQSTDPNVRGVQVNLQNGGTVVNTAAGLISAPTGNISLVGLNVQQAGVLLATTSVDEAGSISLIAHDGVSSLTVQTDNFTVTNYYVLPTRLGTVELSPGSLTTILPEENGLTALDGQPQGQSIIRAEGQTVNVLSNASIVAPSGAVSLEASTKPVNIFAQDNPSVAGLSLSYGLDAGRVYVADGVTIDVSGLQDVPVSASDNAVMVNVRSNELRDSPINRNGILYGSNVWVNVNDLDYVGTDQIYTAGGLLEVSGWLGLVPRTIDQRLTTGGSVSIFSTGDAILRPGASINIAGGSLAHQAGYVQTTRLVGSDGRIYDINNAPGDMTYVGFAGTFTVGHSHWGVTETYLNPLIAGRTFQGTYTEGKSAGSLSVVAPQAEIDAAVNADAVNGVYQRSAGNMAQNGALTIGDSGLIVPSNVVIAPTVTPPPDVFANSTVTNGKRDPATLLPPDQQQTLYLSAAKLDDADYGSITITSGSGIANPVTGQSVLGGISVVGGATLQVADGGSINLTTAASISIAGQLVAHAGAVSFDTSLGTVTATRDVVLKPGSMIDVSGLWTNDALDPSSSAPTLYNGGKVTIDAKGSVLLGKDTLIDASSGGWTQYNGKLKTGANGLPLGTGGDITLVSNYQVTGTNPPSSILYPGKVVLGGTLRSYGFAGGGRLTIAAPAIAIGGNNPADGQTLWLDTGFFARGGFGEYALVSYNGTTVAPGADIELHAQTLQPTVAASSAPTGASVWSLATLGAPLPFQDAATVNLVLSAADPLTGALTIGAGAQINTDPGATVKLHASSQLTFDGVIDAPGGTVDLDLYGPWSNGVNYLAAPYSPARTLWIGSDARLLAPGLVQTFVDTSGEPSYRLWNGGSVNINEYGSNADYMPYSSYLQPPASNTGPAAPISPTPGANVGYDPLGTVVALAGSVIDVSGAAGTIATPLRQGFAPAVVSMPVATDAGSLSIMASQGLLLDSTLFAQGGGPTSAGGSFSVDQTMWAAPSGSTTYRQPIGELVLTQAMQSFVPTGLKVGDAIPAALQGQLHVSADAIMKAGFASVSLGAVDAVVFNGNVNLQAERSITINARVISATPGANVQLASAYVDIGGGRRNPNYDFNLTVPSYLRGEQPLAGTANLTVNAALIDIEGVLSSGASYTYQPNGTSTAVALPGFANMNFNSQGDIRLVPATDAAGLNQASFLQTLGNLNFTSAQIYPITSEPVSGATANNASNAQFVVRATGAHSVITIARNGTAIPPVPLSAGGDVDFIAPTINQGGVLRAPIGQITFGDPNNSGTAATINLLPGSITSVSADGLLIPWGTPVGNNLYEYGDSNVITTPPQKIVSFYGQSVNVQSGAMIDESGGGDLYGYQFVSGAGGSVDTLNGVNTFAILPSLGSSYAPRSPLMESSNGSASGPNVNLKVGDQIYLSGIPGLAAGYYTLLPGHYALLPGGYKVTVAASDVSPSQVGANLPLATGAYRVSGYRAVASTAIRDPLASEFIVTPGAVVRQQSQYVETTVSSFYQAQALAANAAAPRLPIDAGRLVLSALNSLSFAGTSDFSFAPSGRGGQADIVGTNIDVVGVGDTAAAGVVAISDSSINNIGAQSVLIGGVRTMSNFSDPNQIQITQAATSIEISSHAVLSAPEIMLRATSTLTLDSGAVIDTTQAGALPDYLPIDPKTGRSLGSIALTDGAFLMASNAPTPVPVILTSSGSGAKPSSLVVGAGARVDAGSSLVLANVSNFNLNASAAFGAKAIAISAPIINIGGQSTSGITLTGALLSALTRGDPAHGIGPTALLTLNAGQAVDVYGSAALGGAGAAALGSLTISAPVVQGFGAAGDVATISANELTLLGASTSIAAAGSGQGALALDATELTLGTGDLNFGGFSSLTFSASSQVIGSGIGVFGITGNLAVSAPLVTGNAGADTTLNATGAVSFLPPQIAAVAPITQVQSIGAHLTVNAASITQDTDISLPSGVINLNATSNVTLAAGSVTDVSGALTPFFDVVRISPAGAINLASQSGNVGLPQVLLSTLPAAT